MSAKTLAACSFEPAAQQPDSVGLQSPGDPAAEIGFCEALWREYRLEAINAGLSPAQATEYASALSSGSWLATGAGGRTPFHRGWFYQSRIHAVVRTLSSGLIARTRWLKSLSSGPTAAAGAPVFAPRSRPWNSGGKN